MKRIITYTIVALLAFSSCSDRLDIYPHSAISPDAVTDSDLPALANGMYNKCQNMPRELFILNDLMGGLLMGKTHVAGKELIDQLTQIDNDVVKNTWNGCFIALNNVNNVLNITLNRAETPEVRRIKGSAYFFRAYIYLQLVTHWGDVPIIETSTLENVPRNSAEEVWALIKADLNRAEALLSPYSEVSSNNFLSREAATALKARVALYTGNKVEATTWAEAVINNGMFALADFDKIFRNEANNEVIFAFKNLTEESNVKLSELFYNYSHANKGSYIYCPTIEVSLLFDDNDKRKTVTWDTFGGQNCFNKYPSGQTGTDPFIVTRLAEMYLISAEAQGLKGLKRLNELRKMRGLADVTPASEQEYMELILEERTKEFLTEGHRFYDMVRTGNAGSIGLQDYQLLLPIPESQRLVNTELTQNPGY